MLFFTGISRNSATILADQTKSSKEENPVTIQALHEIKAIAFKMREALEKGNLSRFGELLFQSWQHKKNVSKKISSGFIDECFELALQRGAAGGKIAGAGGGGFMLLYCTPEYQDNVREVLHEKGIFEVPFAFESDGVSIIWNELQGTKKMITPEGYLAGINSIVKRLPVEIIKEIADTLYKAYRENKQLFIMGNGGSAATASHFSCDLAKTVSNDKNHGFRVIPLTDNVALMTAWGNDDGYENIFSGQLRNLLNPGDIVIGISAGGFSPSIVKAMEYANKRQAVTIGFTGMTGGKLKNLCTKSILVPSENYQFIEDVHMIITHLMTSMLKELIGNEGSAA